MIFAKKNNVLKTSWFLYCMRWCHQPASCSNRFKTTFLSTFGLCFLSITYVFRPRL